MKVRLLLGILLAFLFILAGCNKETDTAQHKKEKTKDEKIKIVEEKVIHLQIRSLIITY